MTETEVDAEVNEPKIMSKLKETHQKTETIHPYIVGQTAHAATQS